MRNKKKHSAEVGRQLHVKRVPPLDIRQYRKLTKMDPIPSKYKQPPNPSRLQERKLILYHASTVITHG